MPGEAFGTPGYLRLSYALGDADLVEGVTRMAKLLAARPSTDRRAAAGRPAQGAPAPALHRVDAARDAGRAGRASTASGCPTRSREDWPPQLSGDRRARLVPVPAAVRHGALGAARPRTTCAGCCARPPRTSGRDGSGWLEIQVDPSGYAARFGGHHRVHRAGPRRGRGRRGGHRGRHRRDRRGQPHQAPAGRPDPGPAGRPVRRAGGGRLRAVQRRARGAAPRTSPPAFRIAERAGLLAGPARRRAGRAGQRRGLPGRRCTRTGSATASGPPRTRRVVERLAAARGHAARCARRPTSRSASTPTSAPVPLRALLDGGRAGRARRRRPAAVRLPADRAVRDRPPGARLHRRRAGRAGPHVGARSSAAPEPVRARLLAGIDAWLAARNNLARNTRGTG